jgi:hypothetical protein
MRSFILLSAATVTVAAILSGCASVPQRSARGGILSGTEVERQRYAVKKDPALAGNGQQEVGQSSSAISNSAAPMPTGAGASIRTTAPTGPVAPGAPVAPVAPAAPDAAPTSGAFPGPSATVRPGVTGGTVTGGTVTSGPNTAGGAGTSTTPPGTASPAGTPNDTTTGSTTGGTSPSGAGTGTR